MNSDADAIKWWHLTKAQQKAVIESAIAEFLDRQTELTDHEKYFLAHALSHTARGQFAVALQDISDAHEPASAFSPSFKISPLEIERVNKETLRRALRYSEASPPQEYPIFR
jgi:hypothetical protein